LVGSFKASAVAATLPARENLIRVSLYQFNSPEQRYRLLEEHPFFYSVAVGVAVATSRLPIPKIAQEAADGHKASSSTHIEVLLEL
jgi:hypothetical protein